jgi:ferric-dicitrate binding protein FerR (iron transport regulator)
MTDRSKQHFEENDIPRRVEELPPVEADADFRERLRSAFVGGRLETERPRQAESAEKKRRIAWWHWVVPAAAAAVLLAGIVTLNRGPDLRVLEVTGQGEARVDGRRVALDNIEALRADVHAGSEIETPAGTLVDLLAKDVAMFEITGGTHMSIPEMPGRWFGREAACSLFVGEVRIKTGSRFPGSKLVVVTPEGIVEIAGTLLSVQRDSGGTCVCVLEGTAYVGVDQNDMQAVEPGYRKVMLTDGTVEIMPVEPTHRDGVLDFDERVGSQIR